MFFRLMELRSSSLYFKKKILKYYFKRLKFAMKQPSAILIAPTVFYIFTFARSPKVLEDADSNGL